MTTAVIIRNKRSRMLYTYMLQNSNIRNWFAYLRGGYRLFKNKILMITGGTGSFGNAILDRFVDSDLKEIRIFSRENWLPWRYDPQNTIRNKSCFSKRLLKTGRVSVGVDNTCWILLWIVLGSTSQRLVSSVSSMFTRYALRGYPQYYCPARRTTSFPA